MDKLMNKYFKSSLVTSIFLIVLGGMLIFESEATIITISYIIGGILIALGVLALLKFIKDASSSISNESDIIYGLSTSILGILIIANPKTLASLIPIVLGICIVVNSANKLQYALELRRNNNDLWKMTLIVALLSTLCGIVLIFNPFKGAQMITQILGGFIVIYAILDVISTMTIKRSVKSIKRSLEETIKDAEVIEEKETRITNKKNK